MEGREPAFSDQDIAALLKTAEQGNLEAVRKLPDAGMPADSRVGYGDTALQHAAATGDGEVPASLLPIGEDWIVDFDGTEYFNMPYWEERLEKEHFVIVWQQNLDSKP